MKKIFFVFLACIVYFPLNAMSTKPPKPTMPSQCETKSTSSKKGTSTVLYPNSIRFGN